MACPYPDHPCLFRNYCLEGKKFVLKMPMTIFGYVSSKCLGCGAVLPVVASGGLNPEHGGPKEWKRLGLPPAAREMLGWTKMDGSIIPFDKPDDLDLLPGPMTYVDDRGDNCSVMMVDLPVLDEEELIRQKLEKEKIEEARLRHKLNIRAINPPAVIKEEDGS